MLQNEVRRYLADWTEPSADDRNMLRWMQTVPYAEYMRRVVSAFENGLASGNMRPFDSLVVNIGVTPAQGAPAVDHGDVSIQEQGTGMPHGEFARRVFASRALREVPGQAGLMIERILRSLGTIAMLEAEVANGEFGYGEVLRRVHSWRTKGPGGTAPMNSASSNLALHF